jgi:putative phosphoesterase
MQNIGVISDTHGLLRPSALAALRGSALIIHAGDVGRPDVLDGLRKVAPVCAVRGNVDKGPWADRLPTTEVIEREHRWLYVLHNLDELDLDPVAASFDAVISGHSHQPKLELKQGVLYFNPGSAGPRRFNLPITVGRLTLSGGKLRGKVIYLKDKA